MALTGTTLSAALGADDLTVALASTSGLAIGDYIRIDDEFVRVYQISPSVQVQRGQWGTAAKAHNIAARANFGSPDEFPDTPVGSSVPVPVTAPRTVYLGTATAIDVPVQDTRFVLNSDTTTAYTLANPSIASDGIVVTFTAGTADAYTITNTSGFNGSSTSGDVATFGGAIGDTMTVVAAKGLWNIVALDGVTLG